MRLILKFFALSMLGLLAQSGCNSAEQKNRTPTPVAAASPAAQTPADNARRITVADAKDELARNTAIIIDVRNEASYNAGHVRGAKLIPVGELANHLAELPKDKLIITYCS